MKEGAQAKASPHAWDAERLLEEAIGWFVRLGAEPCSGLVILLYTSCRLPGLGKVGWWRGRAKRGAGRLAICDDMVDRPIHH
jgi:hypothetical protein